MDGRGLRRRWGRFREGLQSRLWPLPTAAIVVAVAAGIALPELDRVLDPLIPDGLDGLFFAGAPDSARTLLGAISSSIVTVTSLVFSLTVVALQLASSQASPRLLRMFASDRRVHATLAIFLGTFAFSLTVLRSVRDADPTITTDDGFVPRIAISVTFALMLVAVVTLTLFLAHLATRLRVETMLRDVHEEATRTLRTLRDEEPEDDGSVAAEPATRRRLVTATRSGFLVGVERGPLVLLAAEHDLVIEVETAVGAGVVEGTPIAAWWVRDPLRAAELDDLELVARIDLAITRAHLVEYERTPVQDVGFGLRQLVDVAVKALSPGVNDPTTAVHALGHVSALLGDLLSHPVPSTTERDAAGVIRVIGRQLDLAAMLDLAIIQPRHYGAADLFVALRLLRMLRELAWRSTHPELAPAIRAHADQVLEAARRTPRPARETAQLEAEHDRVRAALAGEWEPAPTRDEPR